MSGDVVTVRVCPRCGATLPPTASCDGAARPSEPLAQIALEPAEFTDGDGRKRRAVIPRACLERHRGEDGRVRFPRA